MPKPTSRVDPFAFQHLQYPSTFFTANTNNAIPLNQTTKEASMARDLKTFEIIFDDSTTLVLDGITHHSVGETFLTFHGMDKESGVTVVGAYRASTIRSFRQVPEREREITPKNTYRINLSSGGHKDVRADLYRISLVGETQVYEFFSRVSERETREELTIPFVAVKYVERVDSERVQDVTGDGQVDPTKWEDVPVAEAEPLDYVEAVRPRRR